MSNKTWRLFYSRNQILWHLDFRDTPIAAELLRNFHTTKFPLPLKAIVEIDPYLPEIQAKYPSYKLGKDISY